MSTRSRLLRQAVGLAALTFALALAFRWIALWAPTSLYTQVLGEDGSHRVLWSTPATRAYDAILRAARHLFTNHPAPVLVAGRLVGALSVAAYALAALQGTRRFPEMISRRTAIIWLGLLIAAVPFVRNTCGDSLSVPLALLSGIVLLVLWTGFERRDRSLLVRVLPIALLSFLAALLRPEAGYFVATASLTTLVWFAGFKRTVNDASARALVAGALAGVAWWLLFVPSHGASLGVPGVGDVLGWLLMQFPLVAGIHDSVPGSLAWIVALAAFYRYQPQRQAVAFTGAHYLCLLPVLVTDFSADPVLSIDLSRYAIPYVPIALFAAARGASGLLKHTEDRRPGARSTTRAVLVLLCVGMLFDLRPTWPGGVRMEAWQADYDFAKRARTLIPPGATVGLLSGIHVPGGDDLDMGISVPHPLLSDLLPDAQLHLSSPIDGPFTPVEYVILGTTCSLAESEKQLFRTEQLVPSALEAASIIRATCDCFRAQAQSRVLSREYDIRANHPTSRPVVLELIALGSDRGSACRWPEPASE